MDKHQKDSLKTLFVIAAGVAVLGGIALQALRRADEDKSRKNAALCDRRTTEQAFRKFLYPNQPDRTPIL